MLNSLSIENFTVFRKAEFEFAPGINVLAGANATGKTHVMKLLYAVQKNQGWGWRRYRPELPSSLDEMTREDSLPENRMDELLRAVFLPENLGDLVRQKTRYRSAAVIANWNEQPYQFAIKEKDTYKVVVRDQEVFKWHNITYPVFIPVTDMLAHSIGFASLYDMRQIDFDETYRDILSLAFIPPLREPPGRELLELLEEKLEGRVEVKGERFYLSGKNGRFEMHLVAEGLRKLALLYLLIANGSLSSGSVLYWDEPEANLNPSLMDEVVKVLLQLAQQGVQIFLATHSYIILKELDLQRTENDSIRLFALERSRKDGSVTVHPAENYLDLQPNLIAEQFKRIYSMEIKRTFGRKP